MSRKSLSRLGNSAKQFKPMNIVTFTKQESSLLLYKLQRFVNTHIGPKKLAKLSNVLKTAAYLNTAALTFNQVQQEYNIFVMNKKLVDNKWIHESYSHEDQYQHYINPIITHIDTNNISQQYQQCLCFPFLQFKVPRYQTIKVQYDTIQKQVKSEQLSGFNARVFQNCVDLVNGRVKIDWRLNLGQFKFLNSVAEHFPKTNQIIEEYNKKVKQTLKQYPSVKINFTVQTINQQGFPGESLSFQQDYTQRIAKYYSKQFAIFIERLNKGLIKF